MDSKDEAQSVTADETVTFSSSDQAWYPQTPAAAWRCASSFSSLGLSFLNCEMEITLLPTSLDCFED